MQQYTREDIEKMKPEERPKVRCRADCDYRPQDGPQQSGTRDYQGRIVLDGNNPWIEIWAGGSDKAERFSWGLVLQVINDPHAAPIWFSERMQYEI